MGRLLQWLGSVPERPTPSVGVTRDVRGDGWHVRLDLASQVLSLEIPERELAELVGELQPVMSPAYRGGFVSASMLAVKAKIFDDGLYAAAELSTQGVKAGLLSALASVAPPVAAAARLGGLDVRLDARGEQVLEDFLADERESKPLGFYTWSEELRRIFQQDRLLQRALHHGDVGVLQAALNRDPALGRAYGAHLEFVAKLTNSFPDDTPDLRRAGGRYFFPPSRSHEADLAKRLIGDRPIPDKFCVADQMVKRLHDGSLRLDPSDASGWYDLQSWALEALALLEQTPEGTRLKTNARYREQLDDLLRSVLALTRETHVKQLECSVLGLPRSRRELIPVASVSPELSVEPVPTYYERRAAGYDFVRAVLASSGRLASMRRQTADGPAPMPLDEEVAGMAALFRAAAAVARQELGMETARDDVAAPFRNWAQQPDAGDDIRMMVPVFYDAERGRMKVWAILGWDTRELHVSFARPPSTRLVKGLARVKFVPAVHPIAYPVFAEAYVSRILNRQEFRAHCDRYGTVERILKNL